jgi:glycine hydroxymethyltransferase
VSGTATETSGLRIGTPALATRGFGPEDFHEVADVIATALHPGFDDAVGADLRGRVAKLADRHPLYVRR